AEDGIRDRNVTGVQTCALPISRREVHGEGPARIGVIHAPRRTTGGRSGVDTCVDHRRAARGVHHGRAVPGEARRNGTARVTRERSEERRVGKEWRSMWATAQ